MPKRSEKIQAGDRVGIAKHVLEKFNLPDKIYIVKLIGRSYCPGMTCAILKGVGRAIPVDELVLVKE